MEYILWATKKGEPDYCEQLISEGETSLEGLAPAKKWAVENGFDRLRVSTYNGEAPDFSKVTR